MANQTLKHLKFDNKEIQVESAVRDGSGNTISSTYATKSELSNYVTTDTTQDIVGTKNFKTYISDVLRGNSYFGYYKAPQITLMGYDENGTMDSRAYYSSTKVQLGINSTNNVIITTDGITHNRNVYSYPSASGTLALTDDLNYLTTAPTAANTTGQIKIVILSSEPATKYDGYIYLITE